VVDADKLHLEPEIGKGAGAAGRGAGAAEKIGNEELALRHLHGLPIALVSPCRLAEEEKMAGRDDEGVANILALALTLSTSITSAVVGKLAEKGLLSPDEIQEIFDTSAAVVDRHLGQSAHGDDQVTVELKAFVARLKRIAALGKVDGGG
jgi:hypothetical protein